MPLRMNDLVETWSERIRAAVQSQAPMRIVGGGSKDFYGNELRGEIFRTGANAGIVDYDPTELVVTARCGTLLADLERILEEGGQMLAFEPPHFGASATLGGCIACGLAGPRRPYAASVRDVVLGVRLLDGRGDDMTFGGRVMKNVAGFDVSRLIAGSLGTLGVILEASLKCLPLPEAERTLAFELDAAEALRKINEWSAASNPLSASCWHGGILHVRLSGAEPAVSAAVRRLGGSAPADAEQFWQSVREQTHLFFMAATQAGSLWRLSVGSTALHAQLGSGQLIEWGGALRWVDARDDCGADVLRTWAERHGGHATLFRGADKSVGAFHPLPPALLELHRRVKGALDPVGIFNPRRMYAEF
jgi:glycolate oxidase FAD binding subunit